MSADRRKYAGPDRRKNGGRVFKNSKHILRERELALEKLEQYEKDENVGVKVASTLFAAGIFIITALAGYIVGHEKVVFLAIAGAVASLITGEINIRAAKKAARKRFSIALPLQARNDSRRFSSVFRLSTEQPDRLQIVSPR